jgi:hypothetical protein
MTLIKVQVAPGVDKQDTEYGAEGRWTNTDNVRFRYGLPEKIGGWAKVTTYGSYQQFNNCCATSR